MNGLGIQERLHRHKECLSDKIGIGDEGGMVILGKRKGL